MLSRQSKYLTKMRALFLRYQQIHLFTNMHTYQAKLPLQATKDKERTQQIIEQLLLLCANRWQSLHNTIYLVVLLALLHFSWSRKTGLQEPLIYWAIALLILLPRLQYLKQRLQRARLSRNSM